MPSQQPAPTVAEPDASFDAAAFYHLRDALVQKFSPSGETEMTMVTQAALAWAHYKRAYELEDRMFDETCAGNVQPDHIRQFNKAIRLTETSGRVWDRCMQRLFRMTRDRNKAPLRIPFGH